MLFLINSMHNGLCHTVPHRTILLTDWPASNVIRDVSVKDRSVKSPSARAVSWRVKQITEDRPLTSPKRWIGTDMIPASSFTVKVDSANSNRGTTNFQSNMESLVQYQTKFFKILVHKPVSPVNSNFILMIWIRLFYIAIQTWFNK